MEDPDEELWSGALNELFEVAILLPTQTEIEDRCRAIRDLLGCLLEGALHDLRLPPSPIQQRALRWIESGTSGDLTFNDTCQYLGLDPQAVRLRALAGLVAQTPRNLRGGGHRRKVG